LRTATSQELNTGFGGLHWISGSSDGSRLVIAGQGGFMETYDFTTAKLIGRAGPNGGVGILPIAQFWLTDSVWYVGNSLTPDGKTMATFLQDVVVLSDVSTGKRRCTIGGSSRIVPTFAFLSGFAVWAAA